MKISVKMDGLAVVQAVLKGQAEAVRKAAASALNKTARGVRFDVVEKVKQGTQGGATAYTQRAIGVTDANESKLEATVYLRTDAPAKGRPFNKSLGHLFTGGTRRFKRMEGAFRSIGVLPDGWMIVPGDACPLDSYGNPPRALIVQLISYFKAFREGGFRANMTDRRRAKLANAGRTSTGYKTINGVEYFISYGMRGKPGGDRYVHGRFDQHLYPGIWSRTGIHGSNIKPVFMFVRRGNWERRYDMRQIGERTVGRVWQRNFDQALAVEMRKVK